MQYFACRFGSEWKLRSGRSGPEAFKSAFAHDLLPGDDYSNEVVALEAAQQPSANDEFWRLQISRLVKKATTRRQRRPMSEPTEVISGAFDATRVEVPDEVC